MEREYYNNEFLWDTDEVEEYGGANIFMRNKFKLAGEPDTPPLRGD